MIKRKMDDIAKEILYRNKILIDDKILNMMFQVSIKLTSYSAILYPKHQNVLYAKVLAIFILTVSLHCWTSEKSRLRTGLLS